MPKAAVQAAQTGLHSNETVAAEIPPREFLDLTSKPRDEGAIQLLREILTTSRKIVVVAGAGISVAAGIPDFRSSKGMFAQMKAKGRTGQMMFDTSVYRSEETIEEFHEMIGNLYEAAVKTKPTPFHNLLEALAKSDRLLRLYTQNIDFLDTRHETLNTVVPVPAVGPWPKVIAVHGSLEKMTCTKCRIIKDFNPALFRIWKEDMPECNECQKHEDERIAAGKRKLGVGYIRPRMVLYGEPGYDAINIGSCVASDLRNRPDALIVVGTTLKIPGTRTMVKEMSKAIGNRGHCIWLNVDDAPGGEFDDVWDFVIKGDCQKVAELMQGIPIIPKDQSFCAEPPVHSSQETQKDSVVHGAQFQSRNDFWHVVSEASDDRHHGLLTPGSSHPSSSDDEKHNKLPPQRQKTRIVPATTNAATFYAPLRNSTKSNSLKRKRPVSTQDRKATPKECLNAGTQTLRKRSKSDQDKTAKDPNSRKRTIHKQAGLIVKLKTKKGSRPHFQARPQAGVNALEPWFAPEKVDIPPTPAPSFVDAYEMTVSQSMLPLEVSDVTQATIDLESAHVPPTSPSDEPNQAAESKVVSLPPSDTDTRPTIAEIDSTCQSTSRQADRPCDEPGDADASANPETHTIELQTSVATIEEIVQDEVMSEQLSSSDDDDRDAISVKMQILSSPTQATSAHPQEMSLQDTAQDVSETTVDLLPESPNDSAHTKKRRKRNEKWLTTAEPRRSTRLSLTGI